MKYAVTVMLLVAAFSSTPKNAPILVEVPPTITPEPTSASFDTAAAATSNLSGLKAFVRLCCPDKFNVLPDTYTALLVHQLQNTLGGTGSGGQADPKFLPTFNYTGQNMLSAKQFDKTMKKELKRVSKLKGIWLQYNGSENAYLEQASNILCCIL